MILTNLNNLMSMFKVSCIFIGTVVGAGLASGKEIYQFFSIYGLDSFFGFIVCFLMYVFIGNILCDICNKKNLSSYNLLINEICPRISAKILNSFVSLYYLFSSSIIFAASGSIISQFFFIPSIFGTILMIIVSVVILKFSMKGLVWVNSLSVPIMICIIFLIFILFELFSDPINLETGALFIFKNKDIKLHNNIILSCLLYGGFNILSSTGILAPLSIRHKSSNFKKGIFMGSLFLILISMIINYLILSNMPYIAKYDIPLLYVSKIFGKTFQVIILVLIWVEMLSTEISSLYSLAQGISNKYRFSLFKSILLILFVSVPVSIFGFTNLISIIYPFFGLLGLVFIYYIVKYKYKKK